MLNILFFGSTDYSYICLKALMTKYNIVGIVTQPDKPKRNHKLEPTFLKEKMLNSTIPIYQPENIKKEYDLIKKINPDLIVTAAYGQILPKDILEIPKYKSINFHASLLPKYKGASPIRQVILDGEKETGLTSIYMDETVDTGNIILQEKIEIEDNETFSSLYDKFLELLPEFTLQTIENVLNNKPCLIQERLENTYTSKNTAEDAKIDWNKSCTEIERMVRAFYSEPATYCYLNDRKLKIYKVKAINIYHEREAGTLVRIDKNFIRIACGRGYIDIYELQTPGKRVMSAKDYINGNRRWLHEFLNQCNQKIF